MKKLVLGLGAVIGLMSPMVASADWNNGYNGYNGYNGGYYDNNCVCNPWYLVGGVNHDGIFHHPNLEVGGREEVTSTRLGWHVYGGYQFSNWFALETGFISFGRLHLDGDGDLEYTRVNAWAVPLRGKFSYHLGCTGFQVFGLLGAHFYDEKFENSLTTGVANSTRYGMDLNVGVGIEYDLFEDYGLRLAVNRYYNNTHVYRTAVEGSLVVRF